MLWDYLGPVITSFQRVDQPTTMKLSPLSPPPTPGESDDSDAEQRTRLTDSLTQSYPGATLSHALSVMNKDVDDPLSRSCYAELRLEKIKKEELDDEDDDDDLTNLAWLQDSDLLKNIKTGDRSICTSPPPEDVKENSLQHPPHVPYNPQKHVNTKPPYSFSCLIFMAIEDSPDKRLPVKDIYNWILTHFPYFQNAPTGWKNSVRHNLSLNKCFKKVDKDKGSSIGKGSLWMIDPDFRPNLLQALRKTPYHPYHQLQMFNNSPATPTNVLLPGAPRVVPFTTKVTNINSPSPHLFPFLSRRLAQSNGVGSTPAPATLESDIDVANTLVSLKRAAENRRPLKLRNTNGARSRSPSPPEFGSEREKEILKRNQLVSQKLAVLCTSAPCEDHTYSISAETLLNGNDPRELMDSTEGSDGEEEMDEEVDEDEVSDEETEAVYRAAIQRIKLDALAATAAIPTITARIVSERKRTQDTDRDADSKRAADALLNLAAGLTPHNNNNNNNNIDGLEKLLQVAELSEGLAQMKHENNNEEENMDQS